MEAVALQKAVAVIMVKVALLGGAQVPQVPERVVVDSPVTDITVTYDQKGQRRVYYGLRSGPHVVGDVVITYNQFGKRTVDYVPRPDAHGGVLPLAGQKISQDSAAGLTIIVGPDEETVQTLFGPPGEGEKRDVYDVYEGSIEAGEAWQWTEPRFEFPWPEDASAYYLEQVEQDLYRRIELADKEGYSVSLAPKGGPQELSVDVEFAKRMLSGGKYDETIRAYVGQPALIKNVVTATVPLTPGQRTLLLWRAPGPVRVAMEGLGPSAPPDWAVGVWKLAGSAVEDALMIVEPDGAIGIYDEGEAVPQTGFVDARGHLAVKVSEPGQPELVTTLIGALRPNGTGWGSVNMGYSKSGEDKFVTTSWQATRVQGPEEAAKPATLARPPDWAVGDWELKCMDDEVVMTVHPDGLVRFDHWATSAQVGALGEMTPVGIIEEGEYMAVSGKLKPDGTGWGSVNMGYSTSGDNLSPRLATSWKATRVQGPEEAEAQPEQGLPDILRERMEGARQRLIPQTGLPPSGVAVLLEVKEKPEEE